MSNYFFGDTEALPPITLAVEGVHDPDSLARMSGVWIHAAGSVMLETGKYLVAPRAQWRWVAADSGKLELHWSEGHSLAFAEGECCAIPPDTGNVVLSVTGEARILWLALDGPLSPTFLTRMGVLLHMPIKQGALPSQLYLTRQIVQVIVRHSGTSDASFQLQQLMWGLLASHSGQPVAMDAMLSHEIAKVVDALRASQYRDNFSLADMAAISRMPMETFRKRFVAEVGMPPLGYLLFCKMERAKALLQDHYSVKQAGAEVGMLDPYHFSKQFKNIVGMSPSAYVKHALTDKDQKERGKAVKQ